MVAVIDIGNTFIHTGLYEGERLVKKFRYQTTTKFVENKITRGLINKKIDGAAIASVIPRITPRFVKSFKKKLNITPIIVSSRLNCHLLFKYYNPKTLGADRIANVVGGLARYNKDLIIVDAGTATTIDVVLKDGNYLGGLIIPGIETSLAMLYEKTALLPKVIIKDSVSTIGRSTEECIQSGILNGTILMIKGLIKKIREESKKKILCIATGGWGKFLSSKIEDIQQFDPDLCLYGILKIYQYNV